MKQDTQHVSAEASMTDPIMTDPMIDRAPFYHDGMRELQDRFDAAVSPIVSRSIASILSSGSRTAS
jgi:hypothetical protein